MRRLALLSLLIVSTLACYSCSEKENVDKTINLVGSSWKQNTENGEYFQLDFISSTNGVWYTGMAGEGDYTGSFTYTVDGMGGTIFGFDDSDYPQGILFTVSFDEKTLLIYAWKLNRIK